MSLFEILKNRELDYNEVYKIVYNILKKARIYLKDIDMVDVNSSGIVVCSDRYIIYILLSGNNARITIISENGRLINRKEVNLGE